MLDERTVQAIKQVRRNSKLPAGARLFFAEIAEMHDRDSCFAGDEWLAEQLGASKSTVRRWRRLLREAGYIREQKADGKRYLIPTVVIKNDQCDQQQSAKNDQSDQKRSQGPAKNDQDLDKVFTPVGAESEYAHTREDPSRDESTSAPSPRESLDVQVESVDGITEAVLGQTLPLTTTKDEIQQICARAGPVGWDTLREVCHEIKERNWSLNSALVKKRLTNQLEMIQEADGKRNTDNSELDQLERLHRLAHEA